MPIKTSSRTASIRRCGVRHTSEPQVWPDGKFTAAQLKILEADRDVIVERIQGDPPNGSSGGADGGRQPAAKRGAPKQAGGATGGRKSEPKGGKKPGSKAAKKDDAPLKLERGGKGAGPDKEAAESEADHGAPKGAADGQVNGEDGEPGDSSGADKSTTKAE